MPRKAFLRLHDLAETPLASLERVNGLVKMGTVKIGPQDRGKIEFSVRALPKQEIGDAKVSAGPNKQIRVGHARCVEILSNKLLVYVRRFYLGLQTIADNGLDRADNFRTATVADGKVEDKSGVGRSVADTLFEHFAGFAR